MIPSATNSVVWEPALPPPAIIGIGLLLTLVAAGACLRGPRLRRPQRWLLLTLRLAVILLICLFLFQPMVEESIPQRHPRRVALVAVDVSQSMQEKDAPGGAQRIDAARRVLRENHLDASSALGEVRLFAFAETAQPLTTEGLAVQHADGPSTRFHESLSTVLKSPDPGENCVGLFVLSDGHDFEMTPPARTAQLARSNRSPIYAIPFGKAQTFPDLSVRMASWQPSTFVKQRVKLQGAIRATAAREQVVRVELIREGQPARDQRITLVPDGEAPVSFEVFEDEPGQYEYEIRVTTLPDERDTLNNTTFTYLNVTASKVRALLVEGDPHWDTTFLQRALVRNDRVDLDSIVAVGTGKPHVTRSPSAQGTFKMPESAGDFSSYSVIVTGRKVERVLEARVLPALEAAVSDGGVTLVMARGKPGAHAIFSNLAPAEWVDGSSGPVQLSAPGRGGEFLPAEVLATAPGGLEALPPLPVVHQTGAPKTLAAVEAVAGDPKGQGLAPAILHRRHGTGQVLSVAVEGLWKWALNTQSEPVNNVFERFWNQLLLNLLSRSRSAPSDKPLWNVSAANLAVGEKVNFNLHPAQGQKLPRGLQAIIYRDNLKIAETPLAPTAEQNPDQTGSFVLERPGRYRAEVEWPGEKLQCRFAAFAEQRESTDTAINLPYLRTLAEASGGRLVEPTALPSLLDSLERAALAESTSPPLLRRHSLWDTGIVFLFLAALFGVEWFLRRRWGLT